MKETIRYAFTLGLICFFASSVLAIVNGITEPKIKLQKEREENLALKEVLSESTSFRPVFKDDKIIYYLVYNNNKLNGFVIKSQSKGYSSDIEVLAGLNRNLEVIKIKILSHNETPGLGSHIAEPSFTGQFKGKDLNNFDQVQAITGATISSSAVINSVKEKISELKEKLLSLR